MANMLITDAGPSDPYVFPNSRLQFDPFYLEDDEQSTSSYICKFRGKKIIVVNSAPEMLPNEPHMYSNGCTFL